MGDLDDFDLGRSDEDSTERPPGLRGPRPRAGLPLGLLAGVAALVALVATTLFYVFHRPTPRAPAAPAPAPTLAAPTPSPPEETALPSLDQSDALVRELAAGLSSHPQLAVWLAAQGLIRRLAVVVVNIGEGDTPRPHLEFLAPKQRFRATARGRRTVADARGYQGYDAFADAVASLDAAAAVRVYRRLAPLFEDAYRELGHPEGGFSAALERAIAALLEVPVLGGDVELVPHAIGFRYADPRLEALSPAQKQFLRMGPRNVRLVQGKLREIARELGIPEARLPRR